MMEVTDRMSTLFSVDEQSGHDAPVDGKPCRVTAHVQP
jgi:hypothetical protein